MQDQDSSINNTYVPPNYLGYWDTVELVCSVGFSVGALVINVISTTLLLCIAPLKCTANNRALEIIGMLFLIMVSVLSIGMSSRMVQNKQVEIGYFHLSWISVAIAIIVFIVWAVSSSIESRALRQGQPLPARAAALPPAAHRVATTAVQQDPVVNPAQPPNAGI